MRLGPLAAAITISAILAAHTMASGARPVPSPATAPVLRTAGIIFTPTTAPSVVYVIDTSGSMLGYFDELRKQVRKALAELEPAQRFAMLFMAEGEPTELSLGLLPNTPQVLREVSKAMDKVVCRGATDPGRALAKAFSLEPDVVFLATDGDFPDNEAIVKLIRTLNGGPRKVVVHTLALVNRGEQYEKVLKAIAAEHGGTYRFVDQRDMAP